MDARGLNAGNIETNHSEDVKVAFFFAHVSM